MLVCFCVFVFLEFSRNRFLGFWVSGFSSFGDWGFGVEGSGFGIRGSGFGVWGSGFVSNREGRNDRLSVLSLSRRKEPAILDTVASQVKPYTRQTWTYNSGP
jgi:hypothetical protein